MNPIRSLARVMVYMLTGRLRFPRQHLGTILTMADGRRFTLFRHIVITPKDGLPTPQAIFCVRFHVQGMSSKMNQRFSWLPIPFFAGLPGFRAKFWAIEEASGDFQGLYAWQTLTEAEMYAQSFAMHFMTRRAVPGSVSHTIISTETEEGTRWLATLGIEDES